MDDREFQQRAGAALDALYKKLTAAGEEAGFEADFNSGALAIEFEEPPAKFVVSPNAPVRQIWVSAHSKSFKLDWDERSQAFLQRDSGQTLTALIGEAIGLQLGEKIVL